MSVIVIGSPHYYNLPEIICSGQYCVKILKRLLCPQGQVVGVALSFLWNFGIFSGASGVLGALSRSVAALGADNKSADERTAARQQRTIGNVGEGLAEGGDALAKGFVRGFTGLVSKPLQGARTGVGGMPSLLSLLCRGLLIFLLVVCIALHPWQPVCHPAATVKHGLHQFVVLYIIPRESPAIALQIFSVHRS